MVLNLNRQPILNFNILSRSEFSGPKPILFSQDQLASEAALAARPEAIRRGLLLLLHRIVEGVPVPMDEALAVVEEPREKTRPPNRPVTLQLLRVLGQLIEKADWSEISKRVVWAVCTTAYWG